MSGMSGMLPIALDRRRGPRSLRVGVEPRATSRVSLGDCLGMLMSVPRSFPLFKRPRCDAGRMPEEPFCGLLRRREAPVCGFCVSLLVSST
jgi:hypothetical protein